MKDGVYMHVINLSMEEEDEFIRCFLCSTNDKEKTKQIAISYIDRFIGNKMDPDLYRDFRNMRAASYVNSYFHFQSFWIECKPYLMFYIDDYFRLIAVDDSIEYNIKHAAREENYKNIVELNGYQVLYSYYEAYQFGGCYTHYFDFIVCKDNTIYIVNRYHDNEEFRISIKGTQHIAYIDNKQVYCEYEIKTPGLTKKQLKDFFDAAFIINELKDCD